MMQVNSIDNSLISILMPTYNVAPYVEDAVNSILIQTYSKFELIIVDDCSTDGTYEILQRLSSEDFRIQLYRNEVNSKICKTLNRALSYAKGGLIGRMDGDDISLANRFEELKLYLDLNSECALVGSGMITIDEQGKELSRSGFITNPKTVELFMKFKSCIPHIWLARKEVYERLHGYREIPYAEDYDFLLRAIRQGFGIANVNKYLYQCRLREGNTGTANGLTQFKAKDYVYKLNRQESQSKEKLFTEESYKKAVHSSEKELKRFKRAYHYLNLAIRQKSNKRAMIYNTVRAMLGSHYICIYIIDSVFIRIGVWVDKK